MSRVTRNGKLHRPSYIYKGETASSLDTAQLEMQESIRNVLEEILAELKTLTTISDRAWTDTHATRRIVERCERRYLRERKGKA